MTFELPDIVIETATIEELKNHARLVAHVENAIRTHHIMVQTFIIKLANERCEPPYYYPVEKRAYKTERMSSGARSTPKGPARKIILNDIEDDFNIDDFK